MRYVERGYVERGLIGRERGGGIEGHSENIWTEGEVETEGVKKIRQIESRGGGGSVLS